MSEESRWISGKDGVVHGLCILQVQTHPFSSSQKLVLTLDSPLPSIVEKLRHYIATMIKWS